MTKTFTQSAVRVLALAAALTAAPLAAHAGLSLTIPTNALQADAVQGFSKAALASFRAVDIEVKPLGNATPVGTAGDAYNLPITSITLELIKIAGGASVGSALEFTRYDDFDEFHRLTLANFAINFNTKQVLADATIAGQATKPKTPIYNFNEQTSLGLKYQFPLSITGHQVLDKLFLTPEAKQVFTEGLSLPPFTKPILDSTDFGTITIDVAVKFRSKPVSTRPYTPAP